MTDGLLRCATRNWNKANVQNYYRPSRELTTRFHPSILSGMPVSSCLREPLGTCVLCGRCQTTRPPSLIRGGTTWKDATLTWRADAATAWRYVIIRHVPRLSLDGSVSTRACFCCMRRGRWTLGLRVQKGVPNTGVIDQNDGYLAV